VRVTFQVPGTPVGKGRPRQGRSKLGRRVFYTPKATKDYEGRVASNAFAAMRGKAPVDGPVGLLLIAVFEGQGEDREWWRAEPGEPDLDNVLKACLDGANRIIYIDDKQVTKISALATRGMAGEEAHVFLEFASLEGTEP